MNIKESFKASFADGMAFLSELFHSDKGNYGVMVVARSALSAILPKHLSLELLTKKLCTLLCFLSGQ